MKTPVVAPLAKYDMTFRRCLNPQAITVSISSKAGLTWLKKCSVYFSSCTASYLERRTAPCEDTILIHECYDFEEILKFLVEGTPEGLIIKELPKDNPDPDFGIHIFSKE